MANFRMLHTMLRVYDLDKSIDFYTRLLGMKLLRRNDYEGGRFTLAFVGYGDESDHTVLELTHNWDQKEPISSAPPMATSPSACRISTAPARSWRRKASRSRARPAR